jgi:PAS domain S-box-containing protein
MKPEDFLQRDDVPEDLKQWLREEIGVRRQFDALMASMPDTIYFKDTEGRFTRINDAQARVLGLPEPGAAVGRTDRDYFGPEHGEIGLADDLRVVQTGLPILDKEERIPLAGGAHGWMSTTKVPICDGDGAVVGLVGISRPISRRKQAEQALRLTQFSVDHASTAIVWALSDGIVRYANHAAGELLGYESGELAGMPVWEIDTALTPEGWSAFWDTLRHEHAVRVERSHRRKDGGQVPVEAAASHLEFEGQESAVIFVRDLTEARLREEDLRRRIAADRVRTAAFDLERYDDLQVIVAAVARSLRDLGVDAERCSLLLTENLERGAYVGAEPDLALRPVLLPGRSAVRTAIETRNPVYRPDILTDDPYDERARLHGGHSNGVRSVVDIPFAAGTVGIASPRPDAYSDRDIERMAELVAAFSDAYRHVADLRRVQESEVRYRTVFEAARDGMFVLSEDATILACNEAAVALTGYSRSELLETSVADYAPEIEVAESGGEAALSAAVRRASRGEVVGFAAAVRRADGSLRQVEARISRVDAPGRPTVLAVLHDVTQRLDADAERRRLEERVQQTQRLESLSVLAGGVAHDFNNILMGVLGNATLALQVLPQSANVRPLLERIELAGARACELSRQMLAYSGRGRLIAEEVDLAALVHDALDEYRPTLPEGVTLIEEVETELPSALGDAAQIRQVLRELVTNAREALPGGTGTIRVQVRMEDVSAGEALNGYPFESLAPGPHLALRVTDTGIGMDRHTAEHAFEPFFSTKFAGRGLGLAASLGIVRGHRGGIRIQSQPAEGASITVYLPPQMRPAATSRAVPAEGATAQRQAGGGVVLVVDDEEFIRELAGEVLTLSGFTPLFACDGEEAVALFRANAPGLSAVLLDVTMPRMSGPEVLERIRLIRDDVPVILSSGYHEDDATRDLSTGSFTDFLQKPYRPNDLIDALQRVLRRG